MNARRTAALILAAAALMALNAGAYAENAPDIAAGLPVCGGRRGADRAEYGRCDMRKGSA